MEFASPISNSRPASIEIEPRVKQPVVLKFKPDLGKINMVSSLDNRNDLIKSCSVVVIKYSAEWCGPCKAIAPAYHELAAEFDKCVLAEEDVDDDFGNFPLNNEIKAVPTFHIYKNGEFVKGIKGAGGGTNLPVIRTEIIKQLK